MKLISNTRKCSTVCHDTLIKNIINLIVDQVLNKFFTLSLMGALKHKIESAVHKPLKRYTRRTNDRYFMMFGEPYVKVIIQFQCKARDHKNDTD